MLKKHIWQPVCMCSVSNIVTETVGYCYWSSENKCSLKKIKNKKKGALNTACFFFLQIPNPRFDPKREKYQFEYKLTLRFQKLEINDFTKTRWGQNGGAWILNVMLFHSVDCVLASPQNRQNQWWHCGKFICLFCSSSDSIVSF